MTQRKQDDRVARGEAHAAAPRQVKEFKPLELNGTTYEVFSPQWFGIQIANGIVSGAASYVFIEFLKANDFIARGESYEKMFARQLAEISRVIDDAFRGQALIDAENLLTDVTNTMSNYFRAGRDDRLLTADRDSQKLVNVLKSSQLAEVGYLHFLQAGGLRLIVLEEIMKKIDIREAKVIVAERDNYANHHNYFKAKFEAEFVKLRNPDKAGKSYYRDHENLHNQTVVDSYASVTAKGFQMFGRNIGVDGWHTVQPTNDIDVDHQYALQMDRLSELRNSQGPLLRN